MTTDTDTRTQARAYIGHARDWVRETFERAFFETQLDRLLAEAPGTHVLDLGCADGFAAQLAGSRLARYVGVDLHPVAEQEELGLVAHDLSEGIGPVGEEPFDLYFGSFGVASHLVPADLERLCHEIAAHAESGALVALEALGLLSLEWPALWDTSPGPERMLGYRLADETAVHPWAPEELAEILSAAGIEPLRMIDRSIQAGPKVGEGRYWPGIPPVRAALNRLVEGELDGLEDLRAPLPPLPAHPAASVHHDLATRRQALLGSFEGRSPGAIAREIWALDPDTGEGYGHGLLAVGRVR